jgi:hypothetical protein
MGNTLLRRVAVGMLVGLTAPAIISGALAAKSPVVTSQGYDSADLAEYLDKWDNPYGPGELALDGERTVSDGSVRVRAVPFQTAADLSVFDHLKYIAISSSSFDVPENGALEFAVTIRARTPGTDKGRVIRGCYGPSMSYQAVGDPCADPWSEKALEGQQAGVVLNMVNFQTGQLFDWFVGDDTAFALIERLPSNVTGSPGVGVQKAYTQIVREIKVEPGVAHRVAIRFSRNANGSSVEYYLDGSSIAKVNQVGVPLDVQGVKYTGIYPALGPGEKLVDQLDSFVIGHGLFSLLDAFPFQHPDRTDLSVSIPVSERSFGQGADGTWSDFEVTTITR